MTLKKLQAEWRDNKYLTSQPELSPRTLSAFTFEHCADALTPFILQQERDRELIQNLVDALDDIRQYGSDENFYIISEQARSRLKEME